MHNLVTKCLLLGSAFLLVLAGAVPAASSPPARAGIDFDGDGLGDVAVSFDYPKRDTQGPATPILTGTMIRMGTGRTPVLMRPNRGRTPDGFGDANGDGFTDLFVGSKWGPMWIPGGPDGVDDANRVKISNAEDTCSIGLNNSPGPANANALDWNADGFADFACLQWRTDKLYIFLGSPDGPEQVVRTSRTELGLPANHFRDKTALASGDVTGDGVDDLAVGWYGHITIVSSGPDAAPIVKSDFRSRLESRRGVYPGFAVGDVDSDGYADVVKGMPKGGGFVRVLWGGSNGLVVRNASSISQERAGVRGATTGAEYFGQSVAVGDFDADGFGDIAIGVPGDRRGGRVVVVFGSPSRTGKVRSTGVNLTKPGILGRAGNEQMFGERVGVAKLETSGADALLAFTWLGKPHPSDAVVGPGFGVLVPFGATKFDTKKAIGFDPEVMVPNRPKWAPDAPGSLSFVSLLG
ncbi:MAG TPA: VCBS repeat-containing protein [Actinomycetes bacterium]|nr:VCBS repeat-containing protein [Actinomycetes bacterium]